MAAKKPSRSLEGLFRETAEHWPSWNTYERFEQVVSVALTAMISMIILIALARLAWNVVDLLVLKALSPLEHRVFQTVFGMIMTLLIAMEFKHSIIRAAQRRESIIQVKTVILIALLALARKFIILDSESVEAAKIAALALAVLVLGVVYWLVRQCEERGENGPRPRGDRAPGEQGR